MAISVDGVDDNRGVVDKLDLGFAILSDPGARTADAYGVLHESGGIGGVDIARPATFVIGPDGRVRWRSLTENWRVRVRPDAVIDALADLSGEPTPAVP